ncbi:MAG TPA: CFI-box-CTERM domain-containing protein [Kofleriaceae bacterium]|nr:CFI-box-CTERM domain-containing protein [Kofleriaceae bacterium]
MFARLAALAALVLAPRLAAAEIGECHVVDVKLTPAIPASTAGERHEPSQIVAWVETPSGEYKGTIFITQQVGRYGLGNRPGRFDFNSGPMWPYGRRITVFPVWAHRKQPQTFPAVVFRNCCGANLESDDPAYCETLINDPVSGDRAFASCGENNLSHPFNDSSREQHYCQPLMPSDSKWTQADAMSCATQAFTDKGKLSATATSPYPPRADLVRQQFDSPSVELYKQMNPFDAISAATPPPGVPAQISWPIPEDLPPGDYVVWIEVAQAFDHNATYSTTAYPSPPASGEKGIQWASYGLPYRGQPSIVYKVPFTIGTTTSIASTVDYAGYGDPDGKDGALRPPDATITTDTPGSGASRLQLVSENGTTYRVLVTARPEFDYALPGAPDHAEVVDVLPTSATLRFIAPGDDGLVGKVSGYEIRYLANRELTTDNFGEGIAIATTAVPVDPGQLQTIELTGLLPETDYWIGIRALDDCRNTSALTIVKLTTADRVVGEVDWCFVATAAYGSRMANDVELLRHVRDALLEKTVVGELAVTTYYTFGPALAGVIGESDLLRATARDLLRPIIEWVRWLAV